MPKFEIIVEYTCVETHLVTANTQEEAENAVLEGLSNPKDTNYLSDARIVLTQKE